MPDQNAGQDRAESSADHQIPDPDPFLLHLKRNNPQQNTGDHQPKDIHRRAENRRFQSGQFNQHRSEFGADDMERGDNHERKAADGISRLAGAQRHERHHKDHKNDRAAFKGHIAPSLLLFKAVTE